MKNYKQQFEGKKITVMGLGILGRGVGYTKFLAECGADLTVTDLKTAEHLATSIKSLSKYKNIKYILGEHRLEDFRDRDMIIKSAGVPLDSIYINEAKKNRIPVEMDVSLFIKCVKDIKVIGVTGTRGKSMTTALIYEILSKNIKDKQVFLGGNVRGLATLPLLKKAKAGDILVCELDSWQLQGFGDANISPNISVFTSFMPDHMNYYKNSMEDYFKDKAYIFKNQKVGDFLITNKEVKNIINGELNSKIILANKKSVDEFDFIVPGDHQRQNLAYAVVVAEILGIPKISIKKTVKSFKGLEGRLQYLKMYKGIKIYNDNNATTPAATIAGIKALIKNKQSSSVYKKNLILICGGADKKLELDEFIKTVNKYCKAIIMIPGSGTDFMLSKYKIEIENEASVDLKDAVNRALVYAKKGDVILFSPAFASFGMFNNEYERNDLFMKIIKNLK